ncbi:MAG: ABC transporter substrate-binding protein [Bacilli bacterium]
MKHGKWKFGLAASVVALTTLAAGSASFAATGASSQPPLVVVSGPAGTFQENFNPFSGALVGTMGLIYQPLFYFNPNTSKVTPVLGTSFAWSNHNTTLTVHLRHGVRWSDGQPFTAKDVAFTFNYLKRFPQLDTGGVWQYLASVKTEGSYTVQFQFKQVDVPFQWYVLGQTAMMPEHVWAKVADPTKTLNLNPVGTGPYRLHSFNPEEYSFAANPHYWAGEPAVREVQFPSYSSNTSIAGALAAGKIDWASIFIPNIHRVFVNASPKTNHYWFAPSSTLMMYTNFKDPLLSQLPVRQAISLAINRQKINAADYQYAPTANPFDLVLPAEKSWLAPTMAKQYQSALQYNPAKAVAILKKAGFKKNGNGVFVSPSGKPLSFSLQVVSTYSEWVAMAGIITSELHNVGIDVTVQGESSGLYSSNLFQKHQYQLALSWTDTGPTPFYAYYAMLYPNLISNSENWSNPATTKWLNVYAHTSQPGVQHQAVNALEGIVARDLPSIPLVETPTWFEYSTSHFTGWPNGSNPYAQGGPWMSPSNGLLLHQLKPVK